MLKTPPCTNCRPPKVKTLNVGECSASAKPKPEPRRPLGFTWCGGLVLLAIVCALSFGASAIGAARHRRSPSGSRAESSSYWLVSPQLLEAAALKMSWRTKLPLGKGESLSRLFQRANRIYALSNRNYLVSLNRKTGEVIFNETVAVAGLPVLGLELYNNDLISVIGNELTEVNPETGIRRKRLTYGVVCPAVRNSTHYYLAGADKRLHALRASDKVHLFELAADNNSMITSIIADKQFVVFATDAGNVVCIPPNKPVKLWQFDAADAIAGPIVRDLYSLFFASKDTNVYRLDLGTPAAEFVWKHQTAAMLDKAPSVTPDVVYQYVRSKGLSAIDRRTGKLIYQVPGGVDLLAEAGGIAYIITKVRRLVVMDNRKAKRLYTINLVGVSKYVTNVTDSRIYIADDSGRIVCLEPVE